MWYWNGGAGIWMILGVVLMILFWGGLIALIVWGVKKLAANTGSSPNRDPIDIAKERYARGEITAEEFNRIKNDLR